MKQRILHIITLFFIIMMLFAVTVMAADTQCPLCGEAHDLSALSDEGQTVYGMACVIYGGDVFWESSDGSVSTTDLLKFDVTSGAFNGLWASGKSLYFILAGLGKILVIVYCMIEMMDKQMNDLANAEHFAKGFMKIAIGIILIDNGYEIAEWILQVGSHAFNLVNVQLGGLNGAIGSQNACNYEFLKGLGLWDTLGQFAHFLLPYLIMLVVQLLTSVVCWVRVLDIMVRVMFAPIGMSDMVTGGTQSQGFRYLKRLGSAGLQGAIILAITKAYGLISSLIAGQSGDWIVMVMLSFVVCTLVFKASSISNEVMGVN